MKFRKYKLAPLNPKANDILQVDYRGSKYIGRGFEGFDYRPYSDVSWRGKAKFISFWNQGQKFMDKERLFLVEFLGQRPMCFAPVMNLPESAFIQILSEI